MQGSNGTPASLSAASASVKSLRDQIASDLNTQFQGTYLFSGTNVTQAAYAQVGGAWTYQGNSATTQVEVQQGQTVSTTFNGQAIAQGSDSADVLTTLDNLATAISTNDQTGITNGLAALDRAFDRANQAQGGLGASENTVTNAQAQLSTLKTAAQTRDSQLEDANMAEAVTRLTHRPERVSGRAGRGDIRRAQLAARLSDDVVGLMIPPASLEGLVTFSDGLPGFETSRHFVLVVSPSLHPFTLVQGLDANGPSFLAIDPARVEPDYAARIEATDRARLEAGAARAARVAGARVGQGRRRGHGQPPRAARDQSRARCAGCRLLSAESAYRLDHPLQAA